MALRMSPFPRTSYSGPSDSRAQGMESPPPSYPEMRNKEEASSLYDHEKTAQQIGSRSVLEPWLGLRSRLFLCLASYSLIVFLLTGARVLISASQADVEVRRTNDTIWLTCLEAEQAVATLASFPHTLADNFNAATKRSVDDTVRGVAEVLLISITAVEALLVFLVNSYRSLFLCFLQFVVQACISILMAAIQVFSDGVHDVSLSIQATIQGSVDAINATLRASLGGINDILQIVGRQVVIPTVPQPDLSALNNITISNGLQSSLTNLNNSLPTLADLKQRMDNMIQTPFEELKLQINQTVQGFSFDQSTLPVPPRLEISYCNDSLDTSPLEELGRDLRKVAHRGIGLLILFALLLLCFNLLREWFSWHSLRKSVKQTREAARLADGSSEGHDGLDDRTLLSLLQLSYHPLLAVWGLQGAEKIGIRSTEGKTRVRWWLAWISHPASLFLLIMGLVGLLSVEMQIAAVKRTASQHQQRLDGMLDNSVQGVQDRLDGTLRAISADYANKSNTILQRSQDELNYHLFRWVNVTTSTMNDTLNQFMDGVATAVNQTFGNTPLFTPVQSFIDCILGQKVAGIETGLAWMQSNAHATFPVVPVDVLMISPDAAKSALQSSRDQMSGPNGIVSDLVNAYVRNLEKERICFVIMLLLYLGLLAIGTTIALLGGRGHDLKWLLPDRQRTKRALANRMVNSTSLSHDVGAIPVRSHCTSPSTKSGSHRSISKPLHPDVFSIYRNVCHAVKAGRYEQRRPFSAALPHSSSVQNFPIANQPNSYVPFHHAYDERMENNADSFASDVQQRSAPKLFFFPTDSVLEIPLQRESHHSLNQHGQAY